MIKIENMISIINSKTITKKKVVHVGCSKGYPYYTTTNLLTSALKVMINKLF